MRRNLYVPPGTSAPGSSTRSWYRWPEDWSSSTVLERLVGREVALGERPRRREASIATPSGGDNQAQDVCLRRIHLPGEFDEDLAWLLVDREFDVDAPSIGRRGRHREAVMARAEPGA